MSEHSTCDETERRNEPATTDTPPVHRGDSGNNIAQTDHSGHEQMFRWRFWISLVLSLPVIVFSEFIQDVFNYTTPVFPGSEWITPVFAVVIFAYGGVPFLSMARTELTNREPGMMMLISLAITVAFVYSLASLVLPGTTPFFWELVTLIDIMLLGHWMEMRSVRQASGALDELAKLMPDTAERVTDSGDTEEVPIDELTEDDVVLVRPGASVPADGEVVEGESSVDESMITGESRSVDKDPGSEVVAGTVNQDGSLRVRVTTTGDETTLAGIMRLVDEAQESKSRTQLFADRAAGWLFYVALGVAALTLVGWVVATGFNISVLERVVTVLVIACPHALGLAVPLVVAINTSTAAQNGMLIRDRIAMEESRNLDTVVFDKTGTLTEGEMELTDVVPLATDGGSETVADGGTRAVSGGAEPTTTRTDEETVLHAAASAESGSEHPLAQAIVEGAEKRGIDLDAAEDFENVPGHGVRATVDDEEVLVGNRKLMRDNGIDPSVATEDLERLEGEGKTAMLVARGGTLLGLITDADTVKESAKEAVAALRERDVAVHMITGDNERTAKTVAEEVGIDPTNVRAGVLPEDKSDALDDIQQGGRKAMMVGDGVNDAPALATAYVGTAIGSGTDVAIEAADVTLMRDDPLDVVKAIRISDGTLQKIKQNLFWALGYNTAMIPLASLGLLQPVLAAAAMAFSSVSVLSNSLLFRRYTPDHDYELLGFLR
ncbi:heavy metal translocating P-type ATPase [Halococcus sp. PRR34]|uniref:heavy metal translocating P-type ATPase n=1 Tax=Halococcus sp. PRR34 TaxID=3020830 RepID=UPI00235FFD13|nr:heavy metal translocating P-type ATPase [Halococcus sp. PRR34]